MTFCTICAPDPAEWWDNRDNKTNPKAPDFKKKGGRDGRLVCCCVCWRQHRCSAAQVQARPELLCRAVRLGAAPPAARMHCSNVCLPVRLLTLSCRAHPTCAAAPALWINGKDTPKWVHGELERMDNASQ